MRSTSPGTDHEHMRNSPVGEEARHDHAHIAIHFTIPHPDSDQVPIISCTSARHVNGHLVATGPLLALADLDMAYPVVGMEFGSLVLALLVGALEAFKAHPEHVVYGTGGKKVKESLMPQPPAIIEPLW